MVDTLAASGRQHELEEHEGVHGVERVEELLEISYAGHQTPNVVELLCIKKDATQMASAAKTCDSSFR